MTVDMKRMAIQLIDEAVEAVERMHNELSRRIGTPRIGHDRPKWPVTAYRNERSRLSEMAGHGLAK